MSAEVVGDLAGLEAVVDGWRRLAVSAGNAFVTPEWYLEALAVLGDRVEPAVAVARDSGGEVAGVLPLVVKAGSRRGSRASVPCPEFADYVDLVCDREAEDEIAREIAPALAAHLGKRCTLDLGRIEAGRTWPRALAEAWPGSMRTLVLAEDPLPYIVFDEGGWEGYLASRGRGLRSQLGRKMRALQRDHEVRLRISETPQEATEDMATLFALHAGRWGELDGTSSLASADARAFHPRFAVAAQAQGWLRLCLLEVDGTAVAAWYGWRLGDRFAYYQAGFDSAWSRQSVGFLLLAETIRLASEEGAGVYDLLLGGESFKSRFSTDSRVGEVVRLAPPLSAASAGATIGRAARTTVRRLPERTRDRVRRSRERLRGSPGA